MSDTSILKNSAIVRHANTGAPVPGPVKMGQLPLVQVKTAPVGPQIQNGQRKPVEMLPPQDEKSAAQVGGLPVVKVLMTQNGPKPDDGAEQTVIIKDAKQRGVSAGGLPMIQVQMTNAGPQVQTLPTVADGPPQIQAAPPAVSTPRNGVPRQTIAAPRAVALPTVPTFSLDQLMLFRHLVDKGLIEMRASEPESDRIKVAEGAITLLDEVMIATSVRAAAEEERRNAHAPAPAYVAPTTHAVAGSISISPAPSASYTAGRVGQLPQGFATNRVQRNGAMAPRRVTRPGAPLPMVQVRMEGKNAVVQNKAEVDQARAELMAARAAEAAAAADPQV